MDMKSNAQILQAMVRICFDAGDYTLLNDTIMTMSKKRLLIKQAVARMVRDSCEMVPKIVDQPTQQKLIDTLRTVTAGKVW
jgi:26S proteasome regulatory subunit N5